MSLLLGIDTATIAVSVALVRDGVTVAERAYPGARGQTETLHPALAGLLAETSTTPGDLDGVVADVGPGRFTGVRVGLAAAKGLAYAVGIPLYGFTSGAILLEDAAGRGAAVSVVDLRRGEVAVTVAGEPEVLRTTPEGVGELLVARDLLDALLVGDGAVEYAQAIAEGAGRAVRIARDLLAPSAAAACRLAERDGVAVDPMSVAAVYLRGAEVRLGWATRGADASPVRLEVG